MSPAQISQVMQAKLDNGLKVLLQEDHSAPIASFWAWYRVGSRNESPGLTGLSHWVEHMQFKGTPSIEKGQIFRDVSRVGGTLNALTSHDWTAYFETVPSDRIELPLAIESDRMVNSLFDKSEVESERTVILSERQGAENSPGYSLYEEVVGAAFHAHPYRHMVIGYESDLNHISRDHLYDHYRHFYSPSNAFIVVVGDFDATELLARIDQYFGSIPAGDEVPRSIDVKEPEQIGERRSTLYLPSGVPFLRMAFHAPGADSDDLVPLLVADAVLSGGKPMGFGGGGGMGRSARLYRALVASGLARSAGSDMGITIDPYLFQIGVTGLPDSNLGDIERVVDTELTMLRDVEVSSAELARAVRQLESQFVYSAEGVTNQAYWLGQWEIVDDWARSQTLRDEFRAVTAEEVRRAANRYLRPEHKTVGWLLPGESGLPHSSGKSSAVEGIAPVFAWGLDGPRGNADSSPQGFQRDVLPNGIPLLGQLRPNSQSVVVRVRLAAGTIHEAASDSGVAHFTARSTLRGACGRSFEAINLLTDSIGSSLSVDSGREFVEYRVRALAEDLHQMIGLLAQAVIEPDFPDSEVELIRSEQLGAIAETDADTRATADRLMRSAVYPAPNPLGRRSLGTSDSVSQLTAEAVKQYHARRFGPRGSSIAIVGGFGQFEQVVETIGGAFGGWESPEQVMDVLPFADINTIREAAFAAIPGKSQADLAIGIPTISRLDDAYYALDVSNLILGRLGLMGRLGAEVRDRAGLAYYAFSQIEPRADGSLWTARAGVDPANVARTLVAVEREIARMRDEPVSALELEDAKSYLIGVLPLALETHDGVAATLLTIEQFGLGLDYVSRYPAIISAISREDVRDATEAFLDLDRIVIGIAGPDSTNYSQHAS